MTRFKNMLNSSATGLLALTAVFALTACEDGTGPAGTGEAQVILTSTDGTASSVATSVATSTPTVARSATLDQVSSITVEVERVEVRPAGSQSSAAGPWVSLDLTTTTSLDLMDLGATGVEIAADDVEAGDYRGVRLFLGNATITFNEDVTFGSGPEEQTFAGGVAHDLIIPSSGETGVKIPEASFTVEEDATGTVEITFDPAASVQNVNLSAEGIMMAPVLVAGGDSGA